MGVIMAKAFNKPQALADEIRQMQQRRRLERAAAKGDGSDVIELFRQRGLTIIDETKGA